MFKDKVTQVVSVRIKVFAHRCFLVCGVSVAVGARRPPSPAFRMIRHTESVTAL